MATYYAIKDWAKHYETAETRKLKSLGWVPTPTKHDGKGLRRLLKLPDGLACFGAWILLLQRAARMPQRGLLRDQDGVPVSAEDLGDIFGLDPALFERAFEVLTDPKIAWLERVEEIETEIPPGTPADSPAIPADTGKTSGANRTEGNSTEGNRKERIFAEEGEVRATLIDMFKGWIEVYPKPMRTQAAKEAWLSLVESGEINRRNIADVIDGTNRWIKSAEWAREDGRFIPDPATFLIGNSKGNKGRMWNDRPKPAPEHVERKRSSAGVDPEAEYVIPEEWRRNADRG